MSFSLPGYAIFREFSHTSKHAIYRGIRISDQKPVMIKTFSSQHPLLDDVARLKNEYDILSSIQSPSIVNAYALEEQQSNYYLILEDSENITLEKWMRTQHADLKGKLQIALNITQALNDLQNNDIIHKDLQPENILVNTNTLAIQITGFNFATKIQHQRLSFKNPTMLEGTLPYMSPEQTGRMNREIDYRTDFYSLGIILYELFAGELPFKSKDPMELVHAHIAQTPLAPNDLDPSVPEQISNLIMKLLAKKAEERYSSAFSLMHDLQRCMEELKASGAIEPFPLGLSDIYHKLQISHKLYGREKETREILQAFDEVCEGSTQLMLLAGYPGIGKTSIVHEIHKPLLEKKAFFISGKYDQYKANIPYSAFIEAFQDLIRQILTENDDTIAMWREKLKAALGANAGVIIEMIPELQMIIGEKLPIQEFDSQETANRFNFFFQKFIALYASPDTPLVIFLDDLQWVDAASLQLIEMILTTIKTKGLFLIGAYRNNEVTPLHPLMTATQRILRSGGLISQIDVPPLTIQSVQHLITDTLHLSTEKCRSLCDIVYQKTQGNPFFINQLLTFLYEENLLYVDPQEGVWKWHLDKIQSLDVSDNVVDLLIAKLLKCAPETQNVLEIAACIGNTFDARFIGLIAEKPLSYVMKYLLEAIKEGFIIPCENIHHLMWLDSATLSEEIHSKSPTQAFRFMHDKVQQAAYQLMNEEKRKSIHHTIGIFLLKKYKPNQLEDHIFEVIAQLNHAADLITSPHERKEYAQMNLMAAQKAMRTIAYGTALEFVKIGLAFLPESKWETDYNLTLQLTILSAEANYLLFNFDEAARLFDHILKYTKSKRDQIAIFSLKIKLYVSSVNYVEAIRWGRAGLKLLGINLPAKYLKLHILKELIILRLKLLGKEIDSLTNLPVIDNPDHFDIIQLLVLLVPPTYLSSKELFVFVVLKGLNLTLKYGNAPMSSYLYASYGIILNALSEDFKGSYNFGKIAMELNNKFEDKKYVPATKFLVGTFLNPTKNHLRTSIDILQTGFDMGTSIGDFINAVFCQGMMFTDKYLTAFNIDELSKEVKIYLEYVTKIKSHNRGFVFNALRQVFMALKGETYGPSSMQTDEFSEEAFLQMLRDNHFIMTLYFVLTFKMQLCFLFENYELILEMTQETEPLTFCVTGQPMRLENDFYHALALTATYSWKDRSQQKKMKKEIRTIMKRMHSWAEAVPANYMHKYYLIRAELARIENDRETAVEMYDLAISSAKENSYLQNEGIANELFAKFYLSQNRAHIAKQYLIDAHYAFYRWGARAKTTQLEQKYAGIFPILATQELDTLEQAATSSAKGVLEVAAKGSSLDLMAVIKATQSISGEIVLSRLLDQLMQIVAETAGADKVLLILEKEGQWLIEAEYAATLGGKTLRPGTPYKDKKNYLSTAVVNYVLRTKEQVSLDDATSDRIFFTDPYIKARKAQSILCFPLMHQAKLVGVLYLENTLTTRAFTPARVEILKLLTTQIATSLENSLLYSHQAELSEELRESNEKLEDYSHNLEKRVYDRTRELNEKNKQLEETLQQIKEMQKKLIEQEKLVSMTAVTKSIAAEMRNPLNYIYNFASLSQDLLSDIKQLRINPEAKEPIQLIETNLKKINEHSKKADEIITTMIQQSHETEGIREPTDINKLIRDYADLVYYTYYKKDPLFSLTIETDYDPSAGKANVSPQNIGRVFYNLIDNACYATDLKKKGLGGSNYSPIVSIQTKGTEDSVMIKIRDNGAGIPKEVLARVFSPFVTTKPSGKGAGMGLSISHDIIVEDHHGTIDIQSEPDQFTEVTITLPRF